MKARELEIIWVLVDAVDRNTSQEEKYNKSGFINRQEFMQILVRIAIAKYVSLRTGQRTAEIADVCARDHKCHLHPWVC